MADSPDFSQLSDRERAELEQSVEFFTMACENSAEKVVLADSRPRPRASCGSCRRSGDSSPKTLSDGGCLGHSCQPIRQAFVATLQRVVELGP